MHFVIYCILLVSSFCLASTSSDMDSGKESAAELNAMLQSKMGSANDINTNFSNPLNSTNKLSTLDGSTSFDAQLSCQASNSYLKLMIAPKATGDISIISIEQDTSMDGNIDTYATPNWNISGVCGNGFVSCTEGTWDNCQSMIWTTSDSNQIGAYKGAISDLGGCYCINNSCGTGLVWSNMDAVLNTLGGGMSAALSHKNPYYQISSVSQTDTSMTYYGQDPTSCSNISLDSMVGSTSSSDLLGYSSSQSSMVSAGNDALSSNSVSTMLQSSQANRSEGSEYRSCDIRRINTIDEVVLEDVIGFNTGSGSITTCGSDCLLLTLGRVGDNYWGGSCRIYDQSVSFYVKEPDRIESATIAYAKFDDWIQIRANNNVLWSGPYNNWNSTTSRPPGKCELSTSWQQSPNVDFSQYLKQEGDVDFLVRTEVTGGGEGYARAYVKVDTECSLNDEYIFDSCRAIQDDNSCILVSEEVDGVNTYSDYASTGFVPIPSTKTVTGSTCSFDITKDWFEKKRTYICSSDSQYEFDDFFDRKKTITDSLVDGTFNDQRIDPITGDVISVGMNVSPYYAYDQSACMNVCKTRTPMPQNDLSTSGTTGSIAVDPNVYDFKYKECGVENICELEAEGEEVVQACACANEFANAASIMQAMRTAGQGLICTSGELQGLD